MTCANCGREEAAVFIHRSVARPDAAFPESRTATSVDLALCERCARERGIVAGKGRLDIRVEELFDAAHDAGDSRQRMPMACPVCGLELVTLKRDGLLGCSECARHFQGEILRILETRRSSNRETRSETLLREDRPAASFPDPFHVALERALDSEDYEEAARLRDSDRPISPPPSGNPFPFNGPAFDLGAGPDDDVVLTTSARLSRDFVGMPFPDRPTGTASPSRAFLVDRLSSLTGWETRTMSEIGSVVRRVLSERGVVPRSWAADSGSVFASLEAAPIYLLVDETDHLRLFTRLPGFDAARALELATEAADGLLSIPASRSVARDGGIGWVCARLEDCGPGCAISTTLHIPALVMTGLHERFLRNVIAANIVVRGTYSGLEASAGSVFEFVATGNVGREPEELVSRLEAVVSAACDAERRARDRVVSREKERLMDSAGRAYGILSRCRRIGAGEAASLISCLRLAAIVGDLRGVGYRELARLFEELGPASLAMEGIEKPSAARGSDDALRADKLRPVIAGAAMD